MLVAGAALHQSWRPSGGEAASIPALSIEITAFEYTGSDPSRAFVARGLTYYLIARLTQLEDVAVFGGEAGLPAGRGDHPRAGSSYTLFGSVQAEATGVRATAVLADKRTGRFLQSWTFERDLAGLDEAGLQSELADQVILAIRRLCAPDAAGRTMPVGNAGPHLCRHAAKIAVN